MATYLYRLGRWSYDRRGTVLALWLAVLVGVGALAAAFGGTKNNKFEVPGTESQQAQELLEQKYPAASGTYARVVFAAPEGETLKDASTRPRSTRRLKEAKGAAEVSGVSKLTTSKDGTIGYADVVYPVPSSEISNEAKRGARRHRRDRRGGRPAGRVLRRHRRRGGPPRLRVDGHDGRVPRARDHAGLAASPPACRC